MPEPQEVTLLLQRINNGEEGVTDELFVLVYAELRRVAGSLMHGERTEHTLQPTALVHEVWMSLLGASSDRKEQAATAEGDTTEWSGRAHFLRAAARSMRNLLVDHARARKTDKRGGGNQRQPLDDMVAVYQDRGIDVVSLNDAMVELDLVDNQLARLVELRFFGGLGNQEVASVLGISLRSCERGWFTARAFLRTQLGEGA